MDEQFTSLEITIMLSYFIPSAFAIATNHHNKLAIIITNLVLGWTGIGWVVALIWSFTKKGDKNGYK